MEYFGTDLREPGHYRWSLDGDHMGSRILKFNDLPFHPEYLTQNMQKGETIFYQGGGYTVFGICGSCSDSRPGCKSIFWVREIITQCEMVERVKSNSLAKQLIAAMPFVVKWPSN